MRLLSFLEASLASDSLSLFIEFLLPSLLQPLVLLKQLPVTLVVFGVIVHHHWLRASLDLVDASLFVGSVRMCLELPRLVDERIELPLE